jgi:hypothetical protein
LPHLKGNVGFVFTKGDLSDIRDKVLTHRVAAPAKAGALAPLDVVVPKQNTGLGPEKTSFFQALNIQTKITKGTVEIMVGGFILFNELSVRRGNIRPSKFLRVGWTWVRKPIFVFLDGIGSVLS